MTQGERSHTRRADRALPQTLGTLRALRLRRMSLQIGGGVQWGVLGATHGRQVPCFDLVYVDASHEAKDVSAERCALTRDPMDGRFA